MSNHQGRPDFVRKRGDTYTALTVIALDSEGERVGMPVGTTARFLMRASDRGSIKVSAVATVVGPGVASSHADYGKLSYPFVAADVNEAGWYLGEFEVTFPSGAGIETFPNDESTEGSLLIHIWPDIA